METVEGILGRLGRQCYAVLCLGVLLVSVTIAHYYVDCDVLEQPITTHPRRRTLRRLRVLHGHPLVPAPSATISALHHDQHLIDSGDSIATTSNKLYSI